MTWTYALYPEDRVDYFLLGAIATCLLIAAVERAVDFEPVDGDDRADHPDWATLDDCDLQALQGGDEQTVQTVRGETVRLAAVEDDGDE